MGGDGERVIRFEDVEGGSGLGGIDVGGGGVGLILFGVGRVVLEFVFV